MNTTTASIRRDSLLIRMAMDRQHLATALARTPRLTTASFVDPATRDWLMTAALWGLSALKLPAFVKVPLRSAASISLRNRVAALMNSGPRA
ncbi:hypothetical protein FXN63_14990 [Pigmentiphaga aceris]|uniref:Uncharacterized protein n=1 Tax=Pigmentiphaga aceris TaxID=1940612 RepID=A0A5C0B309_9BURK|nr:hypothetical protein [Pigmentiphaga aceris]QEI06997.1 hypothetical protein FXN63_14990 [Pigmentiphaga aceris]